MEPSLASKLGLEGRNLIQPKPFLYLPYGMSTLAPLLAALLDPAVIDVAKGSCWVSLWDRNFIIAIIQIA